MGNSIVLAAEPSPLAALLVGHLQRVSSVLAPCHRGASTPKNRSTYPFGGPSRARRTLAAALATVATLAGCSDDPVRCGPGEIETAGITAVATTPELNVVWGELEASANNDCPPPGGAGSGAISLTLDGRQLDPAGDSRLTLCLPRPDQIGAGPAALADESLVQIINTNADLGDGCRLQLDRNAAASGTITFAGFCADGTDSAGFAISVAGTIPIVVLCDRDGGSGEESGTAMIGGTAIVATQQTRERRKRGP